MTSFTSEPSAAGETTIEIRLEAVPGFTHPGIYVHLNPRLASFPSQVVPVPGSTRIVEAVRLEGQPSALPKDLAYWPSPPSAGEPPSEEWKLRFFPLEDDPKLFLHGIELRSEEPLPVTTGWDHVLTIEFGPWAWPFLRFPGGHDRFPLWTGEVLFRRAGTASVWRSVTDAPYPRAHAGLGGWSAGDLSQEIPCLPAGPCSFFLAGPLPGTRFLWEAELRPGFQEIPVPLPDTLLVVQPRGAGAASAPARSTGLRLWILPESTMGMRWKRAMDLRSKLREPLEGSIQPFLPPGGHQVLARDLQDYTWACFPVWLEEGSPQVLRPTWGSSGAVKLSIAGWRGRPGESGLVRLVHLDSGWFTASQAIRSDPGRLTFAGLPPGRHQALWGGRASARAIGFSDVFQVIPQETLEINFASTPAGGGSFAVEDAERPR